MAAADLRSSARIAAPKKRAPTYPKDHKPAMEVPEGGSSCATCEYVSKDLKRCSNIHFIRWHGSANLPLPASRYCSDWYEPKEGAL